MASMSRVFDSGICVSSRPVSLLRLCAVSSAEPWPHFYLSIVPKSLRIHTAADVGCIVSETTPTQPVTTVSGSRSWRNDPEKRSITCCAS